MKWLKVIEFAGKCCFHGTVRSFLPGRVAEPQRDRHFTFGAGSAFFVPGQRRRKRRHAAACPSRRPSSWHCSTSSTWNDSLAITHQRISWISMNSIVLVVAFIFNFKYYLFILPRKFYNRCFSFFFSVFLFFVFLFAAPGQIVFISFDDRLFPLWVSPFLSSLFCTSVLCVWINGSI